MVDYSKWNKIEVSDDEDDTHPNIDTPSLFRWRHKARLERMAAIEEKFQNFEMRKKEYETRMAAVKEKIDEFKKSNPDNDLPEELVSEKNFCNKKLESLREEEELLLKEKKSQPWNVDTLSKEKYDKSMINVDAVKKEQKTPDDVANELQSFVEKHDKEVKHYGMLSKPEDSARYLCQHPYLASEEGASFLCLWCIDLAVEEKFALLDVVAKQAVSLQFLLEISAAQKAHPREFINTFFSKFASMTEEYKQSFEAELAAFKQRVLDRAKIRIEEARAKVEQEEREKRLGPGGLDPVEVFESLPLNLKECFETKNLELLKTVLTSMPPEEAEYHFKRCIDSGLWLPGPNDGNEGDPEHDYDDIDPKIVDKSQDNPCADS